jgi:hypothetical protein
MSLQTLAQDLASKGRYGDSMMVHMNPAEVQGLQALAEQQGTTLTINPDTGMPEAFLPFLAPLIGAVAPALTAKTFLAPMFATPFATALTTGAIAGLASGSLKDGLMAGLGAFGGASLAGAGAGAAGAGAGATGTQALGSAASQAAGALPTATQQAAGASGLASGIGGAGANAAGSIGNFMQGGGTFQPIQQVAQDEAKKGFFASMSPTQKMMGLGLAGTVLGGMNQPQMAMPEQEKSTYEGPYLPAERQVRYPTPEELRSSREFTYFDPVHPYPAYRPAEPMEMAAGGLASLAEGGVLLEDGSFVIDARTVSEIGNGSSEAGQERLAMLGGIPIKGPGDGVSDDIPANIEGEQEARVARDEVVFPASAVKELGDGSAKKGADKLYAMMERAHEARKEADRGEDSGLGALMPA